MTIPRYASLAVRVAREIRQDLSSARAVNGRLPSEPEIAASCGVSRGTVRQALTILEREGVILRRQGAGTFINEYVLGIQARADMAYEYTELLRIAGYQPGIRFLEAEISPLEPEIARHMGVQAESPALIVQKIFLADGRPAIYCLDIIPQEIICADYSKTDLEKPIFEFLMSCCNRTVHLDLAEIIPAIADQNLASRLSVENGTPMLRFDEIGYDLSGKPVLFSRSFFQDQIVRFTVLRKRIY